MSAGSRKKRVKVLITVKTYPIPSSKYDELVCTAGVTEDGEFIRLYPINFRELPYAQQYEKYRWIEVEVRRHKDDPRKESCRPDCDTIKILEKIAPKRGDWSKPAPYVLKNKARSIEELQDRQAKDRTSLGIFKPKKIHDLRIVPDSPTWKPRFLEELKQQRIFETRKRTLEPPRKVPFKFQYLFECDDPRCKKKHKMMIEDWEVGALFWREVGRGKSHKQAAESVKKKFLGELCSPKRDTHFFVGTLKAHPKNWVIIGVWWPPIPKQKTRHAQPTLFS